MAKEYIFKTDKFKELYNCSFYSVNQIPIEERRQVIFGSMFVSSSVIAELLYVPCIWAISRREHLREPCYKMMLMLGILDMLNIIACGFITGVFAITGTVYCSNPDWIFLAGMYALSIWTAESMTSVLLAINRCITIYSQNMAHTLYDGRRIYLWLAIPPIYFFCFVLFSWPPVYSSLLIGWFFNPHLGYYDDVTNRYGSWMHSLHNALLGPVLFVIYALLFTLQYRKYRQLKNDENSSKSFFGNLVSTSAGRKNMNTFLQVLVISIIHMTASISYIYMQYNPGPFVTLFASYGWLVIEGITPVIYLTMNKSIRRHIFRKRHIHTTMSTGKGQHSAFISMGFFLRFIVLKALL